MTDDRPVGAGRPLDGIRVVSLAEQYPGPFATMILADLGADVVLVERPGGGDPTRRFPGHFAALNRNKRSLAVDLKDPTGAEVLERLVQRSDVLVEGFRPGVMEKLGFGPDELRNRHPGLVYCSISGYGHSGPLSRRGGHDLSIQAMAGFVQGDLDPEPAPLPLADLSSAMFAAVGVLGALVERARTGDGCRVDVGMLDSLLAWRSVDLVSSLNGLAPSPYPPEDPGYGVFKTATGERVALSIAGEDHQWAALCEELGLHGLAGDSTRKREGAKRALQARLREAIARRPWSSLAAALEARGVGFNIVNDDDMVARDPQVVARDMLRFVDDGSGLVATRHPVVYDGRPTSIPSGVPLLGEHSVAVLIEVGYSNEEATELLGSGVVVSGGPHA